MSTSTDRLVVSLCRLGVRESVDRAKCKIKAKKENVVGVQLPVFETFVDGGDSESVCTTLTVCTGSIPFCVYW